MPWRSQAARHELGHLAAGDGLVPVVATAAARRDAGVDERLDLVVVAGTGRDVAELVAGEGDRRRDEDDDGHPEDDAKAPPVQAGDDRGAPKDRFHGT